MKFNQTNPTHNRWMVKIALMYWASGDPKALYEDEGYGHFLSTFGLRNDDETAQWLGQHEHIYNDDRNLKIFYPPKSITQDELDELYKDDGDEPWYNK